MRKNIEKEQQEWLRLWCDDTKDALLPRVALIGDSITEQTYQVVKMELEGIAVVDYFATSYSISSPTYRKMLKAFVSDTNYDVICYNYGLHGEDIAADDYEFNYFKSLKEITKSAKTVICLTTEVRCKDELDKVDEKWKKIVKERNTRAIKVAKKLNASVVDLYELSVKLGKDAKVTDGIHFNEAGVEQIGKCKAKAIKDILSKEKA